MEQAFILHDTKGIGLEVFAHDVRFRVQAVLLGGKFKDIIFHSVFWFSASLVMYFTTLFAAVIMPRLLNRFSKTKRRAVSIFSVFCSLNSLRYAGGIFIPV